MQSINRFKLFVVIIKINAFNANKFFLIDGFEISKIFFCKTSTVLYIKNAHKKMYWSKILLFKINGIIIIDDIK